MILLAWHSLVGGACQFKLVKGLKGYIQIKHSPILLNKASMDTTSIQSILDVIFNFKNPQISDVKR